MRRNLIYILLALLFSVTFVACDSDEPEVPEKPTPNIPNPNLPKVDRTILVYMDADNSLTANVEENIDSIAAGYSVAGVIGNLIIYLDDFGKDPILYQYQLNQDGEIYKDTLNTYSEPWISTSPANMLDIMTDVFSAYPAESYGLVLWSHALSWIPSTKKTSRSWGNDNGYEMDITDLATVLKSIPNVHFDFILFDACFMSGVEVAYELRETTDYIVAAPTEVLEFGFPYKSLIKEMFNYTPETIVALPKCYSDFYDGTIKTRPTNTGNKTVRMDGTISMIKCSEMENLAALTNEIMSAHVSEIPMVNPNTVQKYFRYSGHAFVYDFNDFMSRFATLDELSRLKTQLDKTMAYAFTTDYFLELSINREKYSGISTYILQNNNRYPTWDNFYPTLAWYKASGWDKVNNK